MDERCHARKRSRWWHGHRCKNKATKYGLCTYHFNRGCRVIVWKHINLYAGRDFEWQPAQQGINWLGKRDDTHKLASYLGLEHEPEILVVV